MTSDVDDSPVLDEYADLIRQQTDFDTVVVFAGDRQSRRVGYGFTRRSTQSFREVVGTARTGLHFLIQNHFQVIPSGEGEGDGAGDDD